MITASRNDLIQPALLIGLTGAAGAGKTTVAQHLEAEWAFAHIAFADPIVDMIGALLSTAGIDEPYCIERGLKEQPVPGLGFSYRHMAQTLGTEWARHMLAEDFWLRVARMRLAAPAMAGENVVISDVRFENEAAFIRSLGGRIVRVDRARTDLPAVRDHASEQGARRIMPDTELLNFGSKATLHDQIDRMIEWLRGQQPQRGWSLQEPAA